MKCTNKQQETAECEKRGCDGCAYNEKTADEMFEELGYTETEKYKNGIEYFDDEDESISFTDYDEQGKRIEYSRFEGISMQELQAINKKVQELGWKG